MRRLLLALLFTAGILSGCKNETESRVTESERRAMRDTVDSITNRLAAAISSRNADAAAEYVPRDERIVYVSNGVPICGREYVATLSDYYDRLDSLTFTWDKKEFSFLEPNAVLMVGWASILAIDKTGKTTQDKAIFTFAYHRVGSTWTMAIAHKSSL